MANLVARRASCSNDAIERELIWFLQLLSQQENGLENIARDLMDSFPEKIEQWPDEGLILEPMELARGLEKSCLDPRRDLDSAHLQFHDLKKCLQTCMERWIELRAGHAVVTSLGRKVYETLDYTLESRCLTIIEGIARTGKTFAAKNWCDQHPGRARYAQVPSSSDDAGFFRAIARSLGVSINLNSKAHQLRDRIEDVLQTGDLLLCLDEGHYLFPQSNYREALPHRVNWVLTALANHQVPVCVIVTNQFFRMQKRIEERTGWASAQLLGRMEYFKLPDTVPGSDLRSVAKSLLPEGDAKSIGALVDYAMGSAKYLAAIESVVRRARYLAKRDGRTKVSFSHVRNAILDGVIPSDTALAGALQAASKGVRKGARRSFEKPLQAPRTMPARGIKTDLAADGSFPGRDISVSASGQLVSG